MKRGFQNSADVKTSEGVLYPLEACCIPCQYFSPDISYCYKTTFFEKNRGAAQPDMIKVISGADRLSIGGPVNAQESFI